jgi:type I restriction enzyme S subunit
VAVRIEALGALRNGVNFDQSQEGLGLPVVKVKDFGSRFSVPESGLDELDPTRIAVANDLLLQDGDTVIIRSNGNGELVGRCLFVQKVKRPITFSGFCIRFRPDPAKVNAKYATYLLRSPLSRQQMVAFGSGTGIQNLNQQSIGRIEIELPPLDEQGSIAGFLGCLDDKIELNERANRQIEFLASALFRSWFVDFDPVAAKRDGRTPVGVPAEVIGLFPSHFEDSKIGPIPQGWQVGCLGDVARDVRNQVSLLDVAPDTPYIGLEHMPRNSICLDQWGKASDATSGKLRFDEGNFLFGKLRPYFHKVGVAQVAGVCSTDIVVVEAADWDYMSFVLGHLSSVEFVDYNDAGSGGTRMPRTSWHIMSRYPVVVPPASTARALNSVVEPVIAQLKANADESRLLAALRDTLLGPLLSGELTIKAAERAVGAAV